MKKDQLKIGGEYAVGQRRGHQRGVIIDFHGGNVVVEYPDTQHSLREEVAYHRIHWPWQEFVENYKDGEDLMQDGVPYLPKPSKKDKLRMRAEAEALRESL